MAIQLPDVGTGVPADQTGDSPWLAMKKVRENFSNTTHAASRLLGTGAEQVPLSKNIPSLLGTAATKNVGTARGNVMEVGAFGVGGQNRVSRASTINELSGTGFSNERVNVSEINTDFSPEMVQTFSYLSVNALHFFHWGDTSTNLVLNRVLIQKEDIGIQHLVKYRNEETGEYEDRWSTGAVVYTTKNTTVDSNKNIKTSSPVVRVFADHLDKIHEANDLPIKYTRNGVGDYTIEGTTGLRENSWQIVIPEDDHKNQLIAFTMEDDNGTIHLKTYKRTFNMETFTFGPDLNTPLDIPEGRWVDLHFNDLPHDNEYDTQTEV